VARRVRLVAQRAGTPLRTKRTGADIDHLLVVNTGLATQVSQGKAELTGERCGFPIGRVAVEPTRQLEHSRRQRRRPQRHRECLQLGPRGSLNRL
jgi:hypothetical protein